MIKPRTVAERLIIAADVKDMKDLDQIANVAMRVGARIKVNSFLRKYGYGLIHYLHNRGCTVFADLKLFDVGDTLAFDAEFLQEVKPEMLTVYAGAGIKGLQIFPEVLSSTETLGVTVLTDSGDTEYCQSMHGTPVIENALVRLAGRANRGKLAGVVVAGKEAAFIRGRYPDLLITAADIRPRWYSVKEDDHQNRNRMMEPGAAIMAGADYVIVGKPITRSGNRLGAAQRIVDEIERALSVRV